MIIEVTANELQLLVHAAACGTPSLIPADKEIVRDILRRFQEALNGPA